MVKGFLPYIEIVTAQTSLYIKYLNKHQQFIWFEHLPTNIKCHHIAD